MKFRAFIIKIKSIWIICKNGIQKLDTATQKFVTMANLSDVYFKPIFANKLTYEPVTQAITPVPVIP
jgi:hypothetical protein